MSGNVLIYIAVMAGVTYFIRMIPLTLIKKEITNQYIKSFLYYVPFVTLAVMTFPDIIEGTASIWSGMAGFIVAVLMAFFGRSMFQVSIAACVVVFITELFIC
ncbi:MAG: AzlD domain-containing protein [Clostridia bacterium]|nr:AzlD domain-containing protein [Clostridia bacterium]